MELASLWLWRRCHLISLIRFFLAVLAGMSELYFPLLFFEERSQRRLRRGLHIGIRPILRFVGFFLSLLVFPCHSKPTVKPWFFCLHFSF